MKKTLLSAAAFAVVAVSAVAVAPTTSEAIPAFARQTGAACLSCHFQSFPTLSAFGRSFKMGALTDVGEEALVEDDELSIPAVLNATVVFRPQIATTKSTTTGGVSTTSKSIAYGDQVVLIGGRIGENAGAFVELGGGVFSNHQLFTSFDLGGAKAGINYYNTGFGEDAGLQLMNVWGQHGGMMGMRVVSANQYLMGGLGDVTGLAGQYGGIAAWAGNDMGVVQLGLVAPSDGTTFGVTGNGTFKTAKLVRANGFFDVGGMSLGVGGIFVSGNVGNNGQYILGQQLEMKRWGIDAQLEGEMGDTQFGLYADYASAGSSSRTKVNLYNGGTNTLKGWSIRGTVKPVHNIVFGVGYGEMKAVGKLKTFHIAAEYELYQNFVVTLSYTDQKATPGSARKKTTLLDIEALM